jgi:hypothetical protein
MISLAVQPGVVGIGRFASTVPFAALSVAILTALGYRVAATR